jgi:transcriptional regulator with XRE-family HTH domain
VALGKKLTRVRERVGLSQVELSRRAGLPYNYVARIEAGAVVSPKIETRRKLAKALRVPITEILD